MEERVSSSDSGAAPEQGIRHRSSAHDPAVAQFTGVRRAELAPVVGQMESLRKRRGHGSGGCRRINRTAHTARVPARARPTKDADWGKVSDPITTGQCRKMRARCSSARKLNMVPEITRYDLMLCPPSFICERAGTQGHHWTTVPVWVDPLQARFRPPERTQRSTTWNATRPSTRHRSLHRDPTIDARATRCADGVRVRPWRGNQQVCCKRV